MMWLKIDTPIEKPLRFSLSHQIVRYGSEEYFSYCESLDIDPEKYNTKKYVTFGDSVEYEPIEVVINNEIDAKKWMKEAYSHKNLEYKKDIEIQDKDNTNYLLVGAFPVNIKGNKVTLCYDYWVFNDEDLTFPERPL